MDRPFKAMGERIRQARRAADRTQQDIADALKVSVQSVSQWETGRTQPDADRLEDLAHLIRCDLNFLRTGKGGARDGQNAAYTNLFRRFAELMPGRGAAIDCLGTAEPGDELKDGSVIALHPGQGRLFAYEVEDDEMVPAVRPGDIVVLDSAVPLHVGDFALVRSGAETALREVRGTRLDEADNLIVDLRAANAEHGSMTITLSDNRTAILGVVVELRRALKRR